MTDETGRPDEGSIDAGGQQSVGEGPAGMPGGGVGRREDPGRSGVCPASGADAPADAEVRSEGGWGYATDDADTDGETSEEEAARSQPTSAADALVPTADDDSGPTDGA